MNQCNKEGFSIVHFAAQKGNLGALEMLKISGANIHVQSKDGSNSIMLASIGMGDCDTVRWLINEGVDVNHCNKEGFTAVHNAAQKGNLDVLKLLKKSGANIYAPKNNGSNSIMLASVGTGDCETMSWLIKEGVDVNHSNKKGFTAVHNAAQKGNLDVLKLLKISGANIHALSKCGWNSIISALIGTGDCDTVRWLVEQGIDINHCDKNGFTAVHCAAEKGNLDVLKLFKASGANIHAQSESGHSSIMSASLGTGDCDTVRWLINEGVDVNHCNRKGLTAVHFAAWKGNVDVLKLLKDSGANIHVQTVNGGNSIMLASKGTGDCETVKWLIEQDIDVNHCDEEGFTAVHYAAQKGNLDLLKLIKASGANIHAQTKNGFSSIMSASRGTGDSGTVKWLIEQDIDVNHCDKKGFTAVHNAAQKGNLDVLKLLKASGANIHAQTMSGDNSIMLASIGTGDCDTVRWLIEQGVDVNHCNKEGCTAIHKAAQNSKLDVLKLLKARGASIHAQSSKDGCNSIMSVLRGTGDYDTVRWLIEQGVEVNDCDRKGFTAVHKAAKKSNLHVLKLLKTSGANTHAQSKDGYNSIMSVLKGTGDCDTVRWLIEEGVDVNHSNRKGYTVVHYAAKKGNLDVLKLLKASGANIHAQRHTGNGQNSIMSALNGSGDCDIVSWLIEQGVDVNYCDRDGFTAVHYAAQKGKVAALKLLKESGANIHVQNKDGCSAIMSVSAGTGDCDTLRWLIREGIDVNHCHKDGHTALHIAAEEGKLDVLRLLTAGGANLHALIENDTNVIMSALQGTGDCDCLRWLIEQGIDVNQCNKKGMTAIHHAAEKGNLDVLKLLKINRGNIHAETKNGGNSIMSVLRGTGDYDTLRWLINEKVDMNHCNKKGLTAVHYAAQKGNLIVLKLLKESGANIHAQRENGGTCIMSASKGTGNCETVKWLIEQDIDVNHCDEEGFTAVHNAAQKGNLHILKLLKASGANIHVQTKNGCNPIMSASRGTGDCETMKWLIEQDIDVNHCNEEGFTAVHNAAQKGKLDVLKLFKVSGGNIHAVSKGGGNSIMSASRGTGDCNTVRWLIEEGVDVNHSNKEGFTAVHCAAEKGHLGVLKLLKASGANIHAQSESGDNSIMSALLGTGDCDTVRWLIEQGIDVNHSNKEGFSAVHNAAEKGNLAILKLLKASGGNMYAKSANGENSSMLVLKGTGD